jgi:8-oxo-dGTP pyrophosphatase MutT (NUDIX family)
MEPSAPKKASTVILVRPNQDGKFEVLMTQRPHWMEVLGGFYVFPGGILEQEDWSPEMLERCRGLTPAEAQGILGRGMEPELSLGHWITAIRELFEEAGVLLGVTESGAAPDMKDEELKQKLSGGRGELVQGTVSLHAVLRAQGLYCDASRLIYLTQRTTPEGNPMRFDTRFYLAALPQNQSAMAQSEEVAHSVWVTPAKALEGARKEEMPVIRPTRIVLESLTDFNSWQSLTKTYPVR